MLRLVCAGLVAVLISMSGLAGEGIMTQSENTPGAWRVQLSESLPDWRQIVGTPKGDRPVYGLYVWHGEYRKLRESIKEVGWRSIRIGGPVDDEIMGMLIEDDMEVMRTICLRDAKGSVKRGAFETDDAFVAAYLKHVAVFLERYGPGGSLFTDRPDLPVRPVRHVEIMNEPNFHYMISPREGTPREVVETEREALYAKALPAVYKMVKEKWPTVTVLGFAAGGASAGDLRFIQHVHEQSAAVSDSYDILSTHPYLHAPPEGWAIESWGGYSIDSNLDIIRTTLSRHGAAEKPVWYTEIGWPIRQVDGGRYNMSYNPKRLVSPLMQAAYVCRLYVRAMRLGVGRVHNMFAIDTDGYNAGFFLRDGTWRPSAHAVQTMISILPNPRFIELVAEGDDNLYAYGFSPDGKASSEPVLMAWNMIEPKTIEIRCSASIVTVTDMLGTSATRKPVDGVLTLEVGPCPIYVRGAGGPGTRLVPKSIDTAERKQLRHLPAPSSPQIGSNP